MLATNEDKIDIDAVAIVHSLREEALLSLRYRAWETGLAVRSTKAFIEAGLDGFEGTLVPLQELLEQEEAALSAAEDLYNSLEDSQIREVIHGSNRQLCEEINKRLIGLTAQSIELKEITQHPEIYLDVNPDNPANLVKVTTLLSLLNDDLVKFSKPKS